MPKSGSAFLPLHYGHPPVRLFRKMVELGGILSNLIIEKYGVEVLLEKLADPFWFHSLSLAIGFDWNSSGTTTTTLAALQEAMNSHDVDLRILGGKGARMGTVGQRSEQLVKDGFISESLLGNIRSTAKSIARVDQNLLQDGFDLYMQFICVTGKGRWTVVQQGMNSNERLARRYHWIDHKSSVLINDNRAGLSAERIEESVLDLSTMRSERNRNDMVELMKEKPERLRDRFNYGGQTDLESFALEKKPLNLSMKVDWKKLREIYEYNPMDFSELMNQRGVGKSTLRAISYLAEIVYGDEPSFVDPVKYSFALGGKDGIPRPVDYADYQKCIDFYNEVLGNLKGGDKRLDRMAMNLSRLSLEATHRSETNR
ncbi:MAG: DUF763 domain-containing protein [Candidatus Thermoplasmatota archaeon]|nr:DUF763 domain-containing protein [Candidatus Thermoplasmatota archaeon]MCL5794408.1 DUF763 domain-containing protein [Candidatus Thermoplasmatota archaeon]